MRTIAALLACTLATSVSATDGCRATSGASVRPLVELYTSEGCDSCPPADRWLSKNFAPGGAGEAIALAFHVDYWDRLGWKDRFATAAYTARQYEAMRANRATFVYTPQVLVQGRDFREWRTAPIAHPLADVAARPAPLTLTIAATVGKDTVEGDVDVALAATPKRPLRLALAYVDHSLVSDVKAGENRGERLRHDHVVRVLETRTVASAHASHRIRIARPAEAGERSSLVAFVQDTSSGDVLQALALPLAGCAVR